MFSKDELMAMADMVIAGGKSPQTGGPGMMQAAQLLVRIQQEVQKLDAPPAHPNNVEHLKPVA